MGRLFKLICLLLLVGWCNTFVIAADEETLAQQAEQAGNLREAVNHYVEALKSKPDNQQLRENIIKLAQQIKPPPAIPEVAERHMLRGEAAVETAKDKTGYENAANEFNAAILIAPWLATGYFNLSVVQDKAGNYEEAIRNARFYLLAAPDAADAPDMRKRIVKLEYKLEQMKDQREAETREKQAERKAAEQQNKFNIESLSGIWSRWNDGKWVETVELRINATERKLETKRIKHPLIPPSTSFGAYMWNYDFDGKVFQGSRDEKTENFRLTIANENLLIEEYYYIGGEKMYGGGVTEARGFRFKWKRE